MSEGEQLMTYKEVQDYLKISESTLLRILKDKENPLPVVYLGDKSPRIKLADLQDWVNRQNELYEEKRGEKI